MKNPNFKVCFQIQKTPKGLYFGTPLTPTLSHPAPLPPPPTPNAGFISDRQQLNFKASLQNSLAFNFLLSMVVFGWIAETPYDFLSLTK